MYKKPIENHYYFANTTIQLLKKLKLLLDWRKTQVFSNDHEQNSNFDIGLALCVFMCKYWECFGCLCKFLLDFTREQEKGARKSGETQRAGEESWIGPKKTGSEIEENIPERIYQTYQSFVYWKVKLECSKKKTCF